MSTTPARLEARDLRLAYGETVVVDGLDLDVLDRTVSAVIGPNGCGKSTLLRALGRLLRAERGHVLLDGKRVDRTPTREVAKVLGILPQAPLAPEGLTVADLVARGRHPYQAWYRQWSGDDEAVVAEALAWTGISELAERRIDELSGGSDSGRGSPWRWRRTPTCCCSTSRSRSWTWRTRSTCSTWSSGCTPRPAAPW